MMRLPSCIRCMHTRLSALPCTRCCLPRLTPSRACVQEIADARWMPMEEYADSDFIRSNAAVRQLVQCMRAYQQGMYSGFASTAVLPARAGQQLVVHGLPSGGDADAPQDF